MPRQREATAGQAQAVDRVPTTAHRQTAHYLRELKPIYPLTEAVFRQLRGRCCQSEQQEREGRSPRGNHINHAIIALHGCRSRNNSAQAGLRNTGSLGPLQLSIQHLLWLRYKHRCGRGEFIRPSALASKHEEGSRADTSSWQHMAASTTDACLGACYGQLPIWK